VNLNPRISKQRTQSYHEGMSFSPTTTRKFSGVFPLKLIGEGKDKNWQEKLDALEAEKVELEKQLAK